MGIRHMPAGMYRLAMTVQNATFATGADGTIVPTWSSEARTWRCMAEEVTETDDAALRGNAVRRRFRIVGSWHSELTSRSRLLWRDADGNDHVLEVASCVDPSLCRRRLVVEAVEVTP